MDKKVPFIRLRLFGNHANTFGWEVSSSRDEDCGYSIRCVSKPFDEKSGKGKTYYPLWIELTDKEKNIIYRSEPFCVASKPEEAGSRCYSCADKELSGLVVKHILGEINLEGWAKERMKSHL